MILGDDEIAPDGVRVRIPMDVFVPNTTAFMPCVDTEKTRKELTALFKQHGRGVRCKNRIEGSILGVRFTVTT